MKKTFLTALMLLLAGLSPRAVAQDDDSAPKPMLVVALSSYQQLVDDLDLVGKLSNQPGLGGALDQTINQLTQGQGLPGLDKTKPWGLTVSSDQQQFQILAFLPIADTGGFVKALGPVLGNVQEEEYGWSVELDFQNPLALFIQELHFVNQDGWTYMATERDMLEDLPEDPVEMLDGLEKKYHLAARVEFQNIPEIMRQLGLGMMRNAAEQQLQAQAGEGDVPADVVQQMTKQGLDSVAAMLNELDQLTIGLKLDHKTRKAVADMTVTAVPDTDAARQMARYGESTTRFSGFLRPNAAVSAHVSMALEDDDLGESEAALEMMRTLFANPDDDDDESDARSVVTDLVFDTINEVIEQTIESGRLDGVVSITDDDRMTLLAALRVKDGDVLAKEIEERIETIESDLGFFGIEQGASDDGKLKIYHNSESIPGEEGAQLRELFGDDCQIVVATADEAFYLGIGQNVTEALAEAIEKSESAGEKSVPPAHFNGSISTVMKLAEPFLGVITEQVPQGGPGLQDIVSAFEKGKDRLEVNLEPIERGMHIHLEAEEGILKALGTLLQTMPMPVPGFPQAGL